MDFHALETTGVRASAGPPLRDADVRCKSESTADWQRCQCSRATRADHMRHATVVSADDSTADDDGERTPTAQAVDHGCPWAPHPLARELET